MQSSSRAPVQEADAPAARAGSLGRAYSLSFVLLAMVLLLAFLPPRTSGLAAIATDFRWRPRLIEFFNTLRWRLGDHLFNGTLVGNDGWLFFLGDEVLPDYQHTNPWSDAQLERTQLALDGLQAYLQAHGSTLLVVVVPDKSTVYAQHMPAVIPVMRQPSRVDQLLSYMASNSSVPFLDLRGPLIDASRSQQVYYHTGTHWTDQGAYVGYKEILKALSVQYPALQAYPLRAFDKTHDTVGQDLPRMMGMPQMQERSIYLAPRDPAHVPLQVVPLASSTYLKITSNDRPELPSLLIFHDSFYDTRLGDFLAPHFRRTVAVSFALDRAVWNAQWVHSEPSDIVIIELTERYLDYLYPLAASFH